MGYKTFVFTCISCGVTKTAKTTQKNPSRKYCSNKCQMAHRGKLTVEQWLSTGSLNSEFASTLFIRRHILAEQNECCAICNASQIWMNAPIVFVLDHIDGNSQNNSRQNLRLLCPNCDSQLPTFKSRNRGKGRHYRRERYMAGKSF